MSMRNYKLKLKGKTASLPLYTFFHTIELFKRIVHSRGEGGDTHNPPGPVMIR